MSELVNYSASAITCSTAAGHRCAVEIALAVQRDALVGLPSIWPTGKSVEHSEVPTVARRLQLKNIPRAAATRHRRTIEITRLVHYQFRVEVRAISATKAVNHLCTACSGMAYEHRSDKREYHHGRPHDM